MAWTVMCEPKGKNPGVLKKTAEALGVAKTKDENVGGMIIYLVNGSQKEEVSRVAFVRRPGVCENPDVDFKQQLAQEMDKARAAAKALNDLMFTSDQVSS